MQKPLPLLILLLLSSPVMKAQEPVHGHNINISIDAGFPSLTGINIAYKTPILQNRLAIDADISLLPLDISITNTRFNYYALGFNLYLKENHKGPYFAIDAGILPINTTRIENRAVQLHTKFTCFNTKVGIEIGKKFYFKSELGYSIILFDLEESNEFFGETYGFEIQPTVDFLQFANGKIGIGYHF
jgi:hypothetical protein